MDKITINGVEYIKADTVQTQHKQEIGDCRIIVADRGWVFVGNCTDESNGDVTIRNARVIRKWGTTSGLGQLVNGPTPDTVVDKTGTVRTRAIVTIAVNSGW